MWVLTKKLWENIDIQSNDMGFSQEIKIKAILGNKARWAETLVIYGNRVGEAKLNPFQDGLRNMLLLFKGRYSK
jgi:hypothetical protein